MRAIKEAATVGELEARKQALVAAQVFATKASPVLAPHFADVAPVLLDCASDPSREVNPSCFKHAAHPWCPGLMHVCCSEFLCFMRCCNWWCLRGQHADF